MRIAAEKADTPRGGALMDAQGEIALDGLVPSVYAELRAMAHRQLRREAEGHTLTTTALVHEAYLRLVGWEHAPSLDRAHFLALAARVMRRVLIDHAREYHAAKREGSYE